MGERQARKVPEKPRTGPRSDAGLGMAAGDLERSAGPLNDMDGIRGDL